nr:MAG TPA: hypothetical protein [Caudoviricetes sp.]
MSNKTKKANKVVKEAEVEVEEVVETAETIEATVEDAKNEATENVEVETESKDSETEVEVETKKELRPVAYVKNNWKKLAANALKGAALFGAGYVVGKKVMSGGEQHPSETETEVIDAEFVEKNDDVDVTTEED